jgi:hypothetical protein
MAHETPNPESVLSATELKSIQSAFPEDQLPLTLAFRCSLRYKKQSHPNGACGLSLHFVGIVVQNSTFSPIGMIHISKIQNISVSVGKFICVQTADSKVIFQSPEAVKMAQRLYFVTAVSYANRAPEKVVGIQSDGDELFPVIDPLRLPPLSFLQRFQFTYCANCSAKSVAYSHEVVRYFDAIVRSGYLMIDVSQLPLSFEPQQNANDLNAILLSLERLPFFCGIFCRDFHRPDIFRALLPLVDDDQQLRIVHLENCGASEGLVELAEAIKFNPRLEIGYWNLRGNKLRGCFGAFLTILKHSQYGLLFLDLSSCGLQPDHFNDLFLVLTRNPRMAGLRHLNLAGIHMDRIDSFDKFISKATKIETLDIGAGGPIVGDILRLLKKRSYPLKVLSIRGGAVSDALLSFVGRSSTLRHLDVGGVGLSGENIVDLIRAISGNKNCQEFELTLDDCRLARGGLFPLFRAFLRSDLAKWKLLSFNRTGIDGEDIRTLIPLLRRMPKLESLSLSENLDSTMRKVGVYIVDLLTIPSLKFLTIAGGGHAKLRGELGPLINEALRLDKLVSLDCSGNACGDSCLDAFVRYIRKGKNLQSLYIDGSRFAGIDEISRIVAALEVNRSLITFPFPVLDVQNMVAAQKRDAKTVRLRCGELQIAAMKAINRNRRGLEDELPFPAPPEIRALIPDDARNIMKGLQLKRHSCICDELGLPLPFQRMGEVARDGGEEEEIDSSELDAYGIASMGKIIIENEKSLQTALHAGDGNETTNTQDDLSREHREPIRNRVRTDPSDDDFPQISKRSSRKTGRDMSSQTKRRRREYSDEPSSDDDFPEPVKGKSERRRNYQDDTENDSKSRKKRTTAFASGDSHSWTGRSRSRGGSSSDDDWQAEDLSYGGASRPRLSPRGREYPGKQRHADFLEDEAPEPQRPRPWKPLAELATRALATENADGFGETELPLTPASGARISVRDRHDRDFDEPARPSRRVTFDD